MQKKIDWAVTVNVLLNLKDSIFGSSKNLCILQSDAVLGLYPTYVPWITLYSSGILSADLLMQNEKMFGMD